MHKLSWEHKTKDSQGTSTPSRALAADPWPHCSGVNPLPMSEWSRYVDHLLDEGRESLPSGEGHSEEGHFWIS